MDRIKAQDQMQWSEVTLSSQLLSVGHIATGHLDSQRRLPVVSNRSKMTLSHGLTSDSQPAAAGDLWWPGNSQEWTHKVKPVKNSRLQFLIGRNRSWEETPIICTWLTNFWSVLQLTNVVRWHYPYVLFSNCPHRNLLQNNFLWKLEKCSVN